MLVLRVTGLFDFYLNNISACECVYATWCNCNIFSLAKLVVTKMLSLVIGIFLIASPAIGSSITGNCDDKGLVLSNNRYNGLVIAINPEIQESSAIIDKLKVRI